jgi:hypothetical protein
MLDQEAEIDAALLKYSSLSKAALTAVIAGPLAFILWVWGVQTSTFLAYLGGTLFGICLVVWIGATIKALDLIQQPIHTLPSIKTMIGLAVIEVILLFALYASAEPELAAIFSGIIWLAIFGYMVKQNYDSTHSVPLTASVSVIQFFALVAVALIVGMKVLTAVHDNKSRKIVTINGEKRWR